MHLQPAGLLAAALLVLGLLPALAPSGAHAQAVPNPPDRMTYQGYLVDANGAVLGASAPKNYDVIFRIWNDQSSTDTSHRLWAEQQTVTVDKGYFSVLLGEGSQYSTEPHPNVAGLFAASDASDRYVEITVKGIGSGGSDVTILPRLRLLTSPYAFLAQKAVNASTLVNNSNAPIVSATGTSLAVNGSITATSFSGDGANLANLDGANLKNGSVAASKFSSDIGVWARSSPSVSSYSGSLYLTGANLFMDNAFGLYAKNSANTYEQWMWPRYSDNKTYLNFGSGGFNIRNNSSASVMFMDNSGRVGIGTTSPAAPLHVTSTGLPTAIIDGSSTAGTWLALRNTTSGGTSWDLISTGSGNGEGAGKLLFLSGSPTGISSPQVLTLTSAGYVGIGTATPSAPLYVNGTARFNGSYLRVSYDANGTLHQNFTTAEDFSIVASGAIKTGSFFVFSDARIKTIDGRSDSRKDLDTLLGIEVTDYTMVDTVANGVRPRKKVIGQQVEKVFPQAVSRSTDVVPDIYARSEAKAGWISLTKQLDPALKVGDKVRVITDKQAALHEVTEVTPDGFRVQEPLDGPLFVYGREVNDFRTVDYDAISMLNVSATQELYRELHDKDAEIQRLRAEMDELAAREKAQAVRFDKLESLVNRLSPPIQQASVQ